MAMLERRGIVRKSDNEGEPTETDPDGASEHAQAEADLRAMFDSPSDDAIKVTPSARQPVPGMLNYPVSNGRRQQTEREHPKSPSGAGSELPGPAPYAGAEQARKKDRVDAGASKSAEPQKPTPFFSGADYKDDIFADEQSGTGSGVLPAPAYPVPSNPPYVRDTSSAQPAAITYEKQPEALTVENYTDRYLSIEELYAVLSVNLKRTDTIYLIEEYLKTLPESLPDESRREIVSKIVAASGFDFDLLIGDGVLRMKMLKEYAERFAKYTDDFVSARNSEVDELEQHIMRIRRMIENRRDLHKKQFFVIEAEAQRLKDILTFISG